MSVKITFDDVWNMNGFLPWRHHLFLSDGLKEYESGLTSDQKSKLNIIEDNLDGLRKMV